MKFTFKFSNNSTPGSMNSDTIKKSLSLVNSHITDQTAPSNPFTINPNIMFGMISITKFHYVMQGLIQVWMAHK